MTEVPQKDFDRENRQVIAKFIAEAEFHQDDVSGSAIATITQFIMNLRLNISRKGHDRGWLTPEEIIESQVEELRRCVVDLEAYKIRLTKGATHQ